MNEVKAHILWSYIQTKSLSSYKRITDIIKNQDKLEIATIHETLDSISPGLFHLFNWLRNDNSTAIYGCSLCPGTYFSKFEDLQILVELWRNGEQWEDISLKLYGDPKFSYPIQQHAEISGLYSKIDFNIAQDFSFSLSSTGFNLYANSILDMDFEDAISYSLKIIEFNFLIAPKLAVLIRQHKSSNLSRIKKIFPKVKNDALTCLLQWMIGYNYINVKELESYGCYFQLDTFKNVDSHLENKTKLTKSLVFYYIGNSVNYKSVGVQANDMNPIKEIILKLQNSGNMLWLFIAHVFGYAEVSDIDKLRRLCMNIYLLSPQTYSFLKRCMPSLYSVETIYQYYKPKANALRKPLFYEDEGSLLENMRRIIAIKIGAVLSTRQEPIIVTIGGDAAAVVDEFNVPCNLYCYMLLPLEFKLPVFPIVYKKTHIGAAPSTIRERFDIIAKELQKINIRAIFKAVDCEVTMNTWFNDIFKNFLTNEVLQMSFEEIVTATMQWITANANHTFPISDLIHLFKCARAHIQGHLTCIDPDHFICINIELLKQAAGLETNLENRTNQAMMSDYLVLELFSYSTFIELFKKTEI